MREILCLAIALASFSTICSAQTLTETFGSGANAFTMDFVTIGNPGNTADTTGSPNPVGSVAYTYNLGKYEVSRGQIDKANSAGSLGIALQDISSFGGNGVDRPATGISWYEAAKFVNWLNTNQGYQEAYKFSGSSFQLWSAGDAGYNANNMFRNSQAKYVIASTDEWHKGAYGHTDGSWSNFPNGSDSAPIPVSSGTYANTAVYWQSAYNGPADINNAGGLSPFGTMAQGGNVWELTETAYDGTNDTAGELRNLRGGSWADYGSNQLGASNKNNYNPSDELYIIGFRVASVPEPSSLSLLALGGVVVALRRRR
jgi:formylglycine-generating enzyme required for sulfatase activity